MFGAHYFGARYFPPRYFGEGGSAVSTAKDYFANRFFGAHYFGPYYWGNPGASTTTSTNSGVQRLRAYHDQDAYYRDVARKEALQVQQIRLNELLAQRQEIESKRLADEALRKAAVSQRHKSSRAPVFDPALDLRIAGLVRELAEVNGALVTTRAEISRLDAIEAWEALLAEDEAIIILAASI